MKLDEVTPGMIVKYVPNHAHGDVGHPDCEVGRVTSVNEKFVFVRFRATQEFGTACDPDDLVRA